MKRLSFILRMVKNAGDSNPGDEYSKRHVSTYLQYVLKFFNFFSQCYGLVFGYLRSVAAGIYTEGPI